MNGLFPQLLILQIEYLCKSTVTIIHHVPQIFKMSGKYLIVSVILSGV